MGPKVKKKFEDKSPKIDESEIVTEVMKQLFEIEIGDIKKKTDRLRNTKQELIKEKNEIEEKITQFSKEKKTAIDELKSTVISKEDLKLEKRNEVKWLIEEIKNRAENHEKHIIELENRFKETEEEITKKTEEAESQVIALEDFKLNRDAYWEKYNSLSNGFNEMQKEHLRNLYEIQQKFELMKVRIKKELESKLLELSIEFQATTENKLGDTAHRLIRENIAIENEIKIMEGTLQEYQEDYEKSKTQARQYHYQHRIRDGERDRLIAKAIVQVDILKKLCKGVGKLDEKMDVIREAEITSSALAKKVEKMTEELKNKSAKKEDLKYLLAAKLEEFNSINGKIATLRRTFRKLNLVLRKSKRVAEEAKAIQLIPVGATKEDQEMSYEARMKAYQKRREVAYQKKGKTLIRLLNVLSKAKTDEEVKKILAERVSHMDFDIFEVKDEEEKKELEEVEEVPRVVQLPSVVSGWTSDASLPRSPSRLSFIMEKLSKMSAGSGGLPKTIAEGQGKEEAPTNATEPKDQLETIKEEVELKPGNEEIKEEAAAEDEGTGATA